MTRPVRAGASERWLPVAYAFALAGGGALILLGSGRFALPCAFRELTGLYCPGCGSGRVLSALAHLDLPAAWRANAFVVVALPIVLYALVREGASAWGLAELPWPKLHHRWTWVLLAAAVVFWLLRNVEAWPFLLLAPR